MTKEEILAQMNETETTVVQPEDGKETEIVIEEDTLPKDADGNVDYKAALANALKDKATIEKNSKSALIQKKRYREILENIAGTLEAKPTGKETLSDTISKEEFAVEMFKIKHQELSDEDVTTLHQLSKATGKTMEETMQTPVFKSYIKEITENKELNNAIPSFKTRSAVSGGEQSNTKAYQDKIISMYPKNLQKYFNKNKDK